MDRVAGAVLCGGASRRMGFDKALLDVGGVPMAERVAGVLEVAGCAPVVFVGGDGEALGALGRRCVPDRWPGAGPVGGVLTALEELGTGFGDAVTSRAVIAACDLVDLTVEAVTAVVADPPVPPESFAPVVVADSGRLEPMLACWSMTAVPAIAAAFPVVDSLHGILDRIGYRTVAVPAAALRNLNHPTDLDDPTV